MDHTYRRDLEETERTAHSHSHPVRGAKYFELNYTSISITSTGHLAFSNPHANGTFIVLRSQGNATLTCSPAPCIDVSSLGGAGGTAGGAGATSGGTGGSGNAFYLFTTAGGAPGSSGGGTPAGGATPTAIAPSNWATSNYSTSTLTKYGGQFWVGTGGGGGGSNNASNSGSGAGGRGSGSLLMEIGGSLNLTTTSAIWAKGTDGTSNDLTYGGGGGGGTGGFVGIFYNTLTANSGTIVTTGGSGGAGGSNAGASCGAGGGTAYTAGSNGATGSSCTGGAGATGTSTVMQNINYF